MARYYVVSVKPYDPRDHAQGTVGRDGRCGLHRCGEPAVATLVGRDRNGGHVTLAICRRGAEKYGPVHAES